MNRSLRRTLLGWYALVLVLVVGIFGAVLFLRQRSSALGAVEEDVRTRALSLAAAIEWDQTEGFELNLHGPYAAEFDAPGRLAPYFVVFGKDGTVLEASSSAPAGLAPGPAGARTSAHRREFVADGPSGTHVLVGRDVSRVQHELAEFGLSVALGGGAALLLAFLGGAWLVGGVLRPVRRMSEAAARISASNLSERIDVGETESELGKLARTLNEAFDRLQNAIERQVRFTADASHELRTPVAVLRASTEWALRAPRTPDEYRDALATSERTARRMGDLIDSLLLLARADAQPPPSLQDEVALDQVAREAVEQMTPLARENEVTIETRAEPARVRGDGEELRTLVAALLSNAILHGGRGGAVEVATSSTASRARLEIADHGPGIPPEDLERVFERFLRVDPARNRSTGGTGLGLAIARVITQKHGGTLVAANRSGGGAVFTLDLPCVPPATPAASGGASS